jgi:hypothetical protein
MIDFTTSEIIIVLAFSNFRSVQAFGFLCNAMSTSVGQYVVFLLVIVLSVFLRITTSKNALVSLSFSYTVQGGGKDMVFNGTFNNISVISWR